MKLRFDHSYTNDQNFKFRKKLEKAGFYLRKTMVEHPGKMFCKFIMFPKTTRAGQQYLEFVHTGKGGKDYGLQGFSLGASEPLEAYAQKLHRRGAKVKFLHKNYEWKKNEKDRLPGWNFVVFPKHKSKIFTWITEYEYSPKRKPLKPRESRHPNQVFKILGMDVTLSAADLKLYSAICGKPRNGEINLSCGSVLTIKRGKKSRIHKIVLATRDLNRLVKKFNWDQIVTFRGQPGVLIQNPDRRMWDVLIVEK